MCFHYYSSALQHSGSETMTIRMECKFSALMVLERLIFSTIFSLKSDCIKVIREKIKV